MFNTIRSILRRLDSLHWSTRPIGVVSCPLQNFSFDAEAFPEYSTVSNLQFDVGYGSLTGLIEYRDEHRVIIPKDATNFSLSYELHLDVPTSYPDCIYEFVVSLTRSGSFDHTPVFTKRVDTSKAVRTLVGTIQSPVIMNLFQLPPYSVGDGYLTFSAKTTAINGDVFDNPSGWSSGGNMVINFYTNPLAY